MGSSVHLDNETTLYAEESVVVIQQMLNRAYNTNRDVVLLLTERLTGKKIAVWSGRIRYVTETR